MPAPLWFTNHSDLWLFEECKRDQRKLSKPLTKVVIGQFFEVLIAQVLQAEHTEPNPSMDVYPDIIKSTSDHDYLYEVKASILSKTTLVDCKQMREYRKLQRTEFPFNDPVVTYAFCKYDLESPHRYGTVDRLIEALAQHVAVIVLMPLSVVYKIYEKAKHYDYGIWTRGDKRDSYIRPPEFRFWNRKNYRESIRNSLRMIIGKEADALMMTKKRIKARSIYSYPVKDFVIVEVIGIRTKL